MSIVIFPKDTCNVNYGETPAYLPQIMVSTLDSILVIMINTLVI